MSKKEDFLFSLAIMIFSLSAIAGISYKHYHEVKEAREETELQQQQIEVLIEEYETTNHLLRQCNTELERILNGARNE